MGLILDRLKALPKSSEKYVARTRGELEQLVGFFRNLHMNELKCNNKSMESIVMNDDETNMSNKKILASCIPPLALLLWYLGRVAQL